MERHATRRRSTRVRQDTRPRSAASSMSGAARPDMGRSVRERRRGIGSGPRSWQIGFAWDLGDGTAADVRNVVHTYAAAGTYTAAVTVTDPDGASASAEVTVRVAGGAAANRAPTAQARRVAAGSSRTLVVRLRPKARRQLAALLREAGARSLEAKAVTRVTTEGGTRKVRRTVLLKR